jgi:hypothetical protein
MTHTRNPIESPFERIATFARGVVTIPLQYGAVTVKAQIVAAKHLPPHIAGVLSIADLSESQVTIGRTKAGGVTLVTQDGYRLCDVMLGNGNMRIGLWSVSQKEVTTMSKLDMLTESQNKIYDRMILRNIICATCCARQSSIWCDRIEFENKEKGLETEKKAYMALLAIQGSEDRVPHENYDPSEAVSSSSENENEETAQEQDENVEVLLEEEVQD